MSTDILANDRPAGDWLVGGGAMGELVRATNWSTTPLGPRESWPESLRIAVSICLASRFSMFVWWGPAHINIYNDAYIPMLGQRHPRALGRPARDSWNDIWDVVGPQAELVMNRGEATWNERVKLVMERKGYWEDTYFTWSYSPIRDVTGEVRGLFCAVTEETERVRAEAMVRESAARFSALVNASADLVYSMNADWSQLQPLDSRGFLSQSALPGASWINQYIHPDDQSRVSQAIEQAINHRSVFSFEHRVRRTDGTLGWTSSRAVPLLDDQGKIVEWIGAASDITERLRAEARNRFLIALDDAVRPLDDPHQITLTAAGLLGHHLAVDRCAYADIEPDQDTMNLTGNYVRADEIRSIVGRLRFTDFGEQILGLMRENKPFVVNDIDTHTPPVGDPHAYRAAQIRAVICVPLHKAGRFVATMAVHQVTPRKWEPHEVELVGLVAARCWESIERARVARDLRDSEARYRGIVDQSVAGIAEVDLAGRFITVNDTFCRLTGFAREELMGLRMQDLTHIDDQPLNADLLQAALTSGKPYELEKRYVRKDGSPVWVHNSVAPVHDQRGAPEGVVAVAIDITARRAAEEERVALLDAERAARSEAERAGRLKDDFLVTLSHELRTPLNAILGWSQILEHEKPDQETLDEGLSTIARNARAQTRLIEDLLDMSRIVSGKLRIAVQAVEPALVVEAAIESVRPAADARGVRIEPVLDTGAGPVSGDPHRLQQAVWNLLNNAIKFTPRHGKVQVLLQRVNSHIEIIISDTGQGIRPEFLPHMFERFRQADASTTRHQGGLGIGLALVKEIVALHGGEVRVKSPGEGQGATFIIALPVSPFREQENDQRRRADGAERRAIGSAVDGIDLTGLKLLVVDDDPDSATIAARLLADRGASVVKVGSATQALEALKRERPDALVSDIGMPGHDGYELIRWIRSLPDIEGGRTPALALTAFARSEDRRRALLAGYQSHAAKPVDPLELVTVVASLTGRTGGA